MVVVEDRDKLESTDAVPVAVTRKRATSARRALASWTASRITPVSSCCHGGITVCDRLAETCSSSILGRLSVAATTWLP